MTLGRAAKLLALALVLSASTSTARANVTPTTVWCCSSGSCSQTSLNACSGDAYTSKSTCQSQCSAD